MFCNVALESAQAHRDIALVKQLAEIANLDQSGIGNSSNSPISACLKLRIEKRIQDDPA